MTTVSDTISEQVVERLMKDGVASLAGIDNGIAGIRAAVDVGVAWNKPPSPPLLTRVGELRDRSVKVLNEAESKNLLAQYGVPVPSGRVVRNTGEAAAAAEKLGYPVVVKALGVAHKTEAGGVRLNLGSEEQVRAAVMVMSGVSDTYLIEKMIEGVVAELIVGVVRDEQFGPFLLVGGGGILVELMKDSVSLLLPTNKERVLEALGHLKCAPLFDGYRGAPPVDLNAAADVILAVTGMVEEDPSSIIELDINPLILLAKGRGVVAADALISLNVETTSEPG
jgi:acetyl-CoA synthetase